jgi:hypothetical protein
MKKISPRNFVTSSSANAAMILVQAIELYSNGFSRQAERPLLPRRRIRILAGRKGG